MVRFLLADGRSQREEASTGIPGSTMLWPTTTLQKVTCARHISAIIEALTGSLRSESFGRAQQHCIRGNNVSKFASMLTQYAKAGAPDEADLFIVRAVLLYKLLHCSSHVSR